VAKVQIVNSDYSQGVAETVRVRHLA
jgi:hypothetical protein